MKIVSAEVRNSEDPYMVFAYTRDNLGTDFTVFLYMSIFCIVIGLITVMRICWYYKYFFIQADEDEQYDDIYGHGASYMQSTIDDNNNQ